MIAQRLEIAERLGLLQDAERESLAGNLEILHVVPHDLKENTGVGAALVQLAGRVQIARSVADGGGDPMLVADREPDAVQGAIMLLVGGNVGEQGHVIARADLSEQRLDGGIQGGALLPGPADPLSHGWRVPLAEHLPGEVFGLLHVWLVEDIDPQDRARDGDRILPAKELGTERQWIAELEGDHWMAGRA